MKGDLVPSLAGSGIPQLFTVVSNTVDSKGEDTEEKIHFKQELQKLTIAFKQTTKKLLKALVDGSADVRYR